MRRWLLFSREKLPQLVMTLISAILLSAVFVLLFERSANKDEFGNLFDAIWWAIVTTATVGYGDKTPITLGGRLVGITLIFFWIGFISLFTATIASVLVERKIKEGKGLEVIKSKGHLIICGWNFNTGKMITELENRSQEEEIVLINELGEEEIQNLRYQHNKLNLKFVWGNFTQDSVLRRANVKDAHSVIILADTSGQNPYEKADERTIIATHTIRYLAPKVRISAELLDSQNEQHLKRAQVDDIIVSSEYGGFLLAKSALSPGIPQLVKDLITSGKESEFERVKIPDKFIGRSFRELSEYFREQHKSILIALVYEEKGIGLEDILSDDTSSIDLFIKERLKVAQKDYLGKTSRRVQVKINPADDYQIKQGEEAIVIS